MARILTTLFAAFVLWLALAGPAVAAPLYTVSAVAGGSTNSFAFGDIFTVSSTSEVTALGALDVGLDGFSTPGGILLGLYRESDKALLASTTVTSSDALTGNFRFASISTVSLNAGVSYRVVAVTGSDHYNHITASSFATFAPGVTYLGSWGGASTSLAALDDFFEADRPRMPNLMLTSVPEPGTGVLFSAALAGLAWSRRHCRA